MAKTEDVTRRLLEDASYGPGEHVRRVVSAKPAKTLTPALSTFFEKWRQPSDKTLGFVSKAFAYGRAVTGPSASYHNNMLRLIKGGHIRACEVRTAPPAGSAAHHDSPYGSQFYVLRAGDCPADIDPAATTFMGSRRRRR